MPKYPQWASWGGPASRRPSSINSLFHTFDRRVPLHHINTPPTRPTTSLCTPSSPGRAIWQGSSNHLQAKKPHSCERATLDGRAAPLLKRLINHPLSKLLITGFCWNAPPETMWTHSDKGTVTALLCLRGKTELCMCVCGGISFEGVGRQKKKKCHKRLLSWHGWIADVVIGLS